MKIAQVFLLAYVKIFFYSWEFCTHGIYAESKVLFAEFKVLFHIWKVPKTFYLNKKLHLVNVATLCI